MTTNANIHSYEDFQVFSLNKFWNQGL